MTALPAIHGHQIGVESRDHSPTKAGKPRRNSRPPALDPIEGWTSKSPRPSSSSRRPSTSGHTGNNSRRPSTVGNNGNSRPFNQKSHGTHLPTAVTTNNDHGTQLSHPDNNGKQKKRKSKAKDPEESMSPVRRYKRWATLFRYLDKSGDCEIDQLEFMSACTFWAESCPRIPEVLRQDFGNWDEDGNGTLCEAEFFTFCDALWQVLGEREFASLEALLKSTSPRAKERRRRAEEKAKLALEPEMSSSSSDSDGELLAEAVKMDVASPDYYSRQSTHGGGHKATKDLQAAVGVATSCPHDKSARKTLRAAIQDARVSGVDRTQVEEAVRLVRRIEVKEVLDRALITENPMMLRVAILNISTMGAEEETINEAKAVLQKLEIREKIQQAIQHVDEQEMEVLIPQAERCGFDAEEVAGFRKKKSEVKVLRAVGKAMQMKNVPMLEKALHLAVVEEMEDLPKVHEAAAFMPRLQQQQEAKKELWNVLFSGTVKEMKQAIRVAEDAGVEQEELRKAHHIFAKADAREALRDAIESEQRGKLMTAVSKVNQAKLDLPEVHVAEAILDKLDANLELTLAIDARDHKELRAAVNHGRMSGVCLSKLEKAELLLAQLQTEAEMKKNGSVKF